MQCNAMQCFIHSNLNENQIIHYLVHTTTTTTAAAILNSESQMLFVHD